MKKIIALAAVAAALAGTPALASTDGQLSTSSSTGTLTVNAQIPSLVRISGLDDLTINVTPEALTSPYFSREDAQSNFCVYSNVGADGAYTLTVTGDAAAAATSGGPFALTGTGGKLNYSVWTSDDTSGSDAAPFKAYQFPGSTQSFKTTAGGKPRPTSLNCANSGDNASVHIGIDNATVLAAQAGTYTGTLTVTVSTL